MLDLINYSNSIQLQASEILSTTKIIDTLKEYGDVSIVGSYDLGLMYKPDIDINVICDNPKEKSFDILKRLISEQNFQKYQYGDFAKFNRINRPKSYIIVLIIPFNGLNWEIEIWFHDKEYFIDDKLINKIKNGIKEEDKLKILKAKEKAYKIQKITKYVSSYEIYKKIIKLY